MDDTRLKEILTTLEVVHNVLHQYIDPIDEGLVDLLDLLVRLQTYFILHVMFRNRMELIEDEPQFKILKDTADQYLEEIQLYTSFEDLEKLEKLVEEFAVKVRETLNKGGVPEIQFRASPIPKKHLN